MQSSKLLLSAALFLVLNIAAAQTISPELLDRQWPARWISDAESSAHEPGVYLFRKNFQVAGSIEKFIIHVSADNRYRLFVNGQYVGNGPARGDLMKWYFETYDIAPLLRPGTNVISAVVWDFHGARPVAQFSSRTGLVVQGNGPSEQVINTDKSWAVMKDRAYDLIPVNLNAYYVVGPGEKFDAKQHPWNWMDAQAGEGWKAAAENEHGMPLKSHRQFGAPADHVLYPRQIPAMEERRQNFHSIRRSSIPKISDGFIQGMKALVIPANTTATILLDQQHLTTAYPVLSFSGGRNSSVRITYAESLFDENKTKGNRNDVQGKTIIGNTDMILPDGSADRSVQTLWWRTFRYVELAITTKEEPLTLNHFFSIFTAYPFREQASFKSGDPALGKIWEVGWRTQRLCAAESYFDCPYYEQLQYAGDTRIQAFISTYVSGDTRLVKSALESFRDSHLPFGLTQSRYPSYQPQVIPPFSLIWITMIHDYWMLNEDPEFIRSTIPAVMDVIQWYETHIDSTGMLGRMEWWNFVDWVEHKNWEAGVPPGVTDSHSAIINLQYVYTLEKAAQLLQLHGMDTEARKYLSRAEAVKKRVRETCYDTTRGLFADVPEKTTFSQHVNVLAILTNTLPADSHQKLFQTLMQDRSIAQCSFYFRFYLIEAMRKCGLADEYIASLGPWHNMLQTGLTTFAEQADPTRSDCHAWSASPVYHMLSLVAGITPAEPGFRAVRIEPHPGKLEWIDCTMPHRAGPISVNLKKTKSGDLAGAITLPENLSGMYIWKEQSILLKPGLNKIGK